jgi:hypothetical protein
VTAAPSSGAHASGDSAREALERAQEYVDEAESVEYTATGEALVLSPNPGEGTYSYRGSAEDSAVFPNRGHSLIEFDGFFTEMLYIGKDVYFRDAPTHEELMGLRFAKVDLEEDDILTGQDFFLLQRPQDLDDVLEAAGDPEIIDREQGRVLLQLRFPARMLEPLALETFTDVDGRLEVARNGRPERLVVDASASSTRMELDYRFSRWNRDLTITAPPKSERDPTPVIDEEQVAAYTETPLYQPAAIPRGWVLDYAEVVPAGETGHGCRDVNVDYDEPDGEGFILTFQLPLACADDSPTMTVEGDAVIPRRDFTTGPYRGYIEDDPDFPGDYSVALDVNGTRFEAETTGVTEEQVAQILATLVPLDLANPPPATIRFESPRTGR